MHAYALIEVAFSEVARAFSKVVYACMHSCKCN